MKQSTGDSKSARGATERRLRPEAIEDLLDIVAKLRRAVDAGGRKGKGQVRPRVRYADQAEDGDAAPAQARQTSGVWGR